jgi:microcystin-dependent protein
MPSCTNNSTITGMLVTSTDTINGKRLSFKQDTSLNWNSTISAGNVIRFDVDAKQFVKSVANPNYSGSLDLSNAEVVGIVESIAKDVNSGLTYATVITHGLINYPGLMSTIAGISSDFGGAGGTDIFFLDPITPGGITFGIEPGNGYVAKPVLQVCPVSDGIYNSIVINYLGYETSEAEAYTIRSSSTSIGDIKIVDSSSDTPDGWIDSGQGQFLSISSYQDAYSMYGTNYGAKEELTVNGSSSFVSSLINKNIRPIVNSTGKGTATFGQVVSVDTNNNKITIQYNNKGFSLWKSSYTKYELDVAIGTTKTIAITSGQLTHFKTPALQTNINVVAGDQNEVVNFNTKTLLRVKKDTVVSYLPDSAIFNSIQVSGTLSTENITDVDSKLVDLETRIQTLEQKLGI